jgi:hypothetical protein
MRRRETNGVPAPPDAAETIAKPIEPKAASVRMPDS